MQISKDVDNDSIDVTFEKMLLEHLFLDNYNKSHFTL